MGWQSRLPKGVNREPMPLIQQVMSVYVAEVKLIVEVHTARHHVLRERIGSLEDQPAPETSLSLHEQRIVVVEAGGDQRVDLAETGSDPSLGETSRRQIREQ